MCIVRAWHVEARIFFKRNNKYYPNETNHTLVLEVPLDAFMETAFRQAR